MAGRRAGPSFFCLFPCAAMIALWYFLINREGDVLFKSFTPMSDFDFYLEFVNGHAVVQAGIYLQIINQEGERVF